MEYLKRINQFNPSQKTIRWANIVLIWCCLELITALIGARMISFSIVIEIPAFTLMELYDPYLDGGMRISAGFLPALFLKIFQQNFWVAVIGTLTLVVHYSFVLF